MGTIRKLLGNTMNMDAVNNVLEIGIGKGDFMERLIECFDKNTSFIGIDVVDEYVETAQERFNDYNLQSIKMSADELDFGEGVFDLVCISNTLHHLEDPNKVIEEMKRVVKADGYILIHEMICDEQNPKQEVHVGIHHFCADIDRENGIFHNYTYATSSLVELINDLGLKITYDQKYLVQDEQAQEDEYKTLDTIYRALEKNIEKFTSVDKRNDYKKELDRRFTSYRKIGFELATEYIMIAQK